MDDPKSRLFREFSSYEDQLDYLASLGLPMLPVHRGPAEFFRQFNRFLLSTQKAPDTAAASYCLFADPRLNLVFPAVREELEAACMRTACALTDPAIKATLEEMGITTSILAKSTLVLSGGERKIVAMAKAAILEPVTDRLVMASPIQWLDTENKNLVEKLFRRYERAGKQVEVLGLRGEFRNSDDRSPTVTGQSKRRPVLWELSVTQAEVSLNSTDINRPTESLTYEMQGGGARLASPTLIEGANGVGKTAFAKALCGLAQLRSGHLRTMASGSTGSGRIVMQECLDQMFCLSANGHMSRVFAGDKEQKKSATRIYATLESVCRDLAASFPKSFQTTLGTRTNSRSVLLGKIALISERLCSVPSILILDEPSWALPPAFTRVLITSVVEIAHEMDVAIAIISHDPEAHRTFANSRIQVTRSSQGRNQLTVAA